VKLRVAFPKTLGASFDVVVMSTAADRASGMLSSVLVSMLVSVVTVAFVCAQGAAVARFEVVASSERAAAVDAAAILVCCKS
jgi:hypothetical protein